VRPKHTTPRTGPPALSARADRDGHTRVRV
jgi:hypothetical protein